MELRVTSSQESFSAQTDVEPYFQSALSRNILPILSNLSQIYLPFQSLEFFQIIICILQFLCSSFWTPAGNYWIKNKFMSILHYIAFFSTIHRDNTENIILCCVLLAVVFIISILFLIEFIHFYKTRRIIKTILIIIRIYFIVFGGAIIHPLSSLIGHLFDVTIQTHKASHIIMLIFTFIGFLLAEGLFYINQKFINQSIYIHKSLWVTFDSTLLLFLFMWNPLFLLLSHLFKYYPIWAVFILIFFHILLIISSFVNYTWMSCIDDLGNAIQPSILCSLIFNDIFRIVVECFNFIQEEYFVLICFLVFVVLILVFILVNRFIRKKINLNLSYSQLNALPEFAEKDNLRNYDPSIEGKFNYFAELNLDHKINKAMIYLIVGFTSCSEMFVDYSLIHFCMENYQQSSKMMVLLIHLLSYFKSEGKRLDMLLKLLHLNRDLDFYSHFIFYQVNHVKIFRQTTSTDNSTTRLNELKHLSKNLENQLKTFWSLETADMNTLNQLERQQRSLSNLWDESIEDNWSSVSFREEHVRFLIESCTDFQRAVRMENIKEKIDILRNSRDDLCFLSLLLCFPQYLKNKIVDYEGNPNKKRIKDATTTSTNSHSEKDITSSSDYDFTIEEQIANSIMSYGRLRLSMQNVLNLSKPSMSKVLFSYSLFSMIVSTVLICFIFASFTNSFDSFDDWNRQVGVLVELRVAYAKSFLCLSIFFGKSTGRFLIDSIDCNTTIVKKENQYFMMHDSDFDILALYYANEAKKQFSNLMEAITQLSMEKVGISTLTDLLFGSYINSTACINGEIFNHVEWSMEQSLNFDIMTFQMLSSNTSEVKDWFINNTFWCHDITTFPSVGNMFTVIQNALTYDLSNSSAKTSQSTLFGMILIGPCHLLICVLPMPIIIYFYSKEINELIRIMLNTDQEYKDQAKSNISLSALNENDNLIPPIENISFNWKFFLFSFSIILCFCCFILFVELILYFYKVMSDDIRNFGFFTCYFSLVRAYLIEILIETMNAVYNVDINANYITNIEFDAQIYNLLKLFENMIYEILNDTPDSPSSVGKDVDIDDIILTGNCAIPERMVDLHDVYKCASLNQLLSSIHVLLDKIIGEKSTYEGKFKGKEVSNLYHLIFAHSVQAILDVINRFALLQQEKVNDFNRNIMIFFICGIICLLIWSFILFFVYNQFRRIYNMTICLIRRLPPVGLINNHELANYLLSKKSENVEMGVSHTIFNNSFDGIVCINLDGIVEIVNKGFSNDYGYSTDQLVGQLISTIFEKESKEKLENQLKLFKNHESSNYYADDMICFTNDGKAVPSFINLFSIKENENCLILVIRDETILLQKKKRLELAKKRSQDLLEQIMPPRVLMMLKEGKSEISFTVPSASVMFVNIVNFSGFSSDLSPQQIMGTLSSLFGSFDIWIQKYPMMTKIKLIGDCYMAACGLFADDKQPEDHAQQCIDFGIRVLNILNDTNIKLNVNLQIRIGVNTGGPIIAGVLGTENRVFDIIGDAINVASRLEHKSEPGHLLMSEQTYYLIKDCGYIITPIGKVFLKGKGDMEAYSI